MNNKILLNKNRSKQSTNTNNILATRFSCSKKLLPIDPISATVSEINVYNEERKKCNNIRLTVEINPICSNVLFNNITEIVKNEGTDDVKCLNYGEVSGNIKKEDFGNVKFKDIINFTNEYRIPNAIRDTQINNLSNNFNYHCGIDIFNNHILRSKTFKTVCPLKSGKQDYFNTINDFMRAYDGSQIKGYSDREDKQDEKPDINRHIYLNEEIMTYKESVSNNLREENGWFGFTNKGKMKVFNEEKNSEEYDWFNVINTRKSCDFINMYPEKELFYFEPLYNKHKQRAEKNWHYCLTYPSSSTTNVNFINNISKGKTTLKIMMFDDTSKYLNGLDSIKLYSISKHGLKKDDIVNIYNDNEVIIRNARVLGVDDDYIFHIYKNGISISKKWINIKDKEIYDENSKIIIDGKEYIPYKNDYLVSDGIKYYIINGEKANIDANSQNLSFARVVQGSEVNYYVRIFSKIPNWKFSKKNVDEYFKGNDKISDDVIENYQKVSNEFESHIGKLAFSKNIYNDNIAEIVFSDLINISNLKDNLGRPLTDIYITLIKNNEGYREWYGKKTSNNDKNINILADTIEYSHCFGKLSCGFKLSKESLLNESYNNILEINNIDKDRQKYGGLSITKINNRKNINFLDDDEIQYNKYKNYDGDINFYGDLCCFSDTMCDEQIIQDVNFRFNTAQREATNDFDSFEYFNQIYYDEIISDDYDYGNTFKTKTYTFGDDSITNSSSLRKEGYYYKPHFRINVKSFSNDITTLYPKIIKTKSIKKIEQNKYEIFTLENHFLSDKSTLYIYDKINNKLHKGLVEIVFKEDNIEDIKMSQRLFYMVLNDNEIINFNKEDFIIFKKPYEVPDYAKLAKDGSCRYYWREIIQNGFDKDSSNENYPFTNNALYINKRINFYLRRQNPYCIGHLKSASYPFDILTSDIESGKENNYYNEKDIQC